MNGGGERKWYNAKPQACREWTGRGSSVGYKESECGVVVREKEEPCGATQDLREQAWTGRSSAPDPWQRR
jgi:hypothetical protein